MSIHISELNVYPIKSCAGIGLKSAEITERGFVFDRWWMLVDENDQFITQRTEPTMALIRPEVVERISGKKIFDQLDAEEYSISGDKYSLQNISLVLHAPNMTPLKMNPILSGAKRTVTIFRDVCQTIDEGSEAADWFSAYLKSPCRLVRFDENFARKVDPKYAKTEQDQVGFPDGYPFLLISETSLKDLNNRLERPVPMNRFRPNIVVVGCHEFAEDTWQRVRINQIDFDLVKPCARCVITTTDQLTAKVSPEPLRTLSKYRNKDNKVLFGQNLIHCQHGKINLGDRLEIIAENKSY